MKIINCLEEKDFSQTHFTILNGKYSETDCKIDLIYQVEIAIQSW